MGRKYENTKTSLEKSSAEIFTQYAKCYFCL